MTPVDYVILFLVVVSGVVGVWRGFMSEALSVATLLVAIFIAWAFADRLEPALGEWVSTSDVRLWVTRVVIFMGVLLAGGVVSWLARKLVRRTGLTALDRALGAAFGIVRAAVLIGLAVLVLEFVGLDQELWWRDAQLRPYAERVATVVKYYAEIGTRYLREQPTVRSARIESACLVAFSG